MGGAGGGCRAAQPARGDRRFAIEIMLRIHYLPQWFNQRDPAMEKALHETPLYREFAGLGDGVSRVPDEVCVHGSIDQRQLPDPGRQRSHVHVHGVTPWWSAAA